MTHTLAALALSPVLAIQAWLTRRTVPQLPEPPGPRHGQAGKGKTLSLLIVGDSAAAGVGTAHQDEALSGQLTARLASRFTLEWKLIARTGATTQSTIRRLQQEEPGKCDVAVTSLGVNDVTSLTRFDTWLDQQMALWQLLRERFGTRHIVVSGLPPMHGFPALPQPLRWFLGGRATMFDRALAELAGKQPDCSFLSLRFTEDAANMASDGFHPGPPVYKEWARRVCRVIEAKYSSPGDGLN